MHKEQYWYLYNILDQFRYHQKRWYWPDSDTRIGAGLTHYIGQKHGTGVYVSYEKPSQ